MLIAVMGDSGSGKTLSLKTLDPKTTIIIDADKKGLPWKGWQEQYSTENKNYYTIDSPDFARKFLMNVNTSSPHVKTLVIDSLNSIMIADEIRRSKEKNYDRWLDLATCIYDIIDHALFARKDLNVICTALTQVDREDSGYIFTHIMTSGKKLNRITLEAKFPVVLLAKCIDGKYVFETHAKNSTVKTPLGAFEADEIPNDMQAVLNALAEY